ncbi:MAG: peptidylprolyl isomerase [Candidatus Gottesmanbacteria bacterium]|nr:peptidylprolyl isomerase [Candidatus Gottesmanbacteria bacterium]
MKKTYILAAVLFVAIVGGAFVWKSQPTADRPLAEAPVQEKQTVEPTTIITNTPVVTPTVSMTKQYTSPPPMTIDSNKTYTATIVTDKGTMAVTLFAKETPVTVNNFVFLARASFYTNTIFHRVMKGFMIQGGDPRGNGTGGPGYSFADEPITREYTRGTIAMANSGPNTNGSQFFIMHANVPLPKQYVIFGAIDPSDWASLATLDAIATAPVSDNGMGEDSKPATPTVLQSMSIKEE